MRVAVYYNNHDVRLEERPVPAINANEVLVRVWASGICGSDVLEWYRLPKAPLVLGHEISGEIVKVGADVENWSVGQRVFVSHHVPCNMCRYCLSDHHSVCDTLAKTNFDPGGFSEYLRVPAINVRNGIYELPQAMSYEQAVFVEPLACVYRGQQHVGWKPGRRVLVIGAGMAGLLHVQLAVKSGAAKVVAVDINQGRLEMARAFGADHTIEAGADMIEKFQSLNDGRLAEIVIVATGSKVALEQAFQAVDRGGAILFFAPTDPGIKIDMPFNDLWRKEIAMTSSYAGSPRDILAAIELISSGRIDVDAMITHRLPLAETQKGFGLVAEAGASIKVVIKPQI